MTWDLVDQRVPRDRAGYLPPLPPLVVVESLSGTLLARTRKSTTQPALLHLPSASPTNRPLTGLRAHEPSENGKQREHGPPGDRERMDHRETGREWTTGRQGRACVRSALYSAGLRPSQHGAPPVAPPCSRLHLPSRRFEKPLERGRALNPTASRRASTNRERAAPPLHFTPAAENSGGRIQAGKAAHHRDPSCFPPRVLGRFPTRKPS